MLLHGVACGLIEVLISIMNRIRLVKLVLLSKLLITIIFGFLHQINLNAYTAGGLSIIPLVGILSIMFFAWVKVFDVAQRRLLMSLLKKSTI